MIDPPFAQRRIFAGITVICVLLLAGGLAVQRGLHQSQLWNRMLLTDGREVIRDHELTAFAIAKAKPLYAAHCSACHGEALQGDRSKGAPNLLDKNWLYGDGSIFDIERTVLYGVRTGQSKSHNVTDMPAFGLTGRLSEAEIRNLVQYLLQLSGRPHQAAAATEGRAVYNDVAKANCADCHGETGQGNSDYGAPDLTVDAWHSGDDSQAFYDAIYFGQHRIMPGWIGTLNLAQIRALAIYIYARSHGVKDD
jgi:cytochrome c oxidase cbb3-type subunit 3